MYINIKSIRNKFDDLIAATKGNIEVFMISEAKLVESSFSILFPSIDRNVSGRRILLYVQDDVP